MEANENISLTLVEKISLRRFVWVGVCAYIYIFEERKHKFCVQSNKDRQKDMQSILCYIRLLAV